MRKSNTSKRIKVKHNLDNQSEKCEEINSYKKEIKGKETEIIKDQQNIYRCPKCPFIPLINVNDKENKVIIDCIKGHHTEMLFSEYISSNFQKNINKYKCTNCDLENNLKKLVKICYECQKIYCNDCSFIHNKKYSNHHIFSIDRIDYICPLHKSKYTQYCFECKKNLCEECLKDKSQKHKIINYKKLELKNNDLNGLKNNLEKEIITLNTIQQIFNDTIKTLSNKFNDIISYKLLYLKFKNNIINTYEPDNTNYQIIDNVNHLKFMTKALKIDQEMNELDIIYELFNFLDSIEYNDEYNNDSNNINGNENNNYEDKNIMFDIKNRIEEVSNEDENDIDKNNLYDINNEKYNKNINIGKNGKDDVEEDKKIDLKEKENIIYKIGNDYIKKSTNYNKNNEKVKIKENDNDNNIYLKDNTFFFRDSHNQFNISNINNIINKDDIKNGYNIIRNDLIQENTSKNIKDKNRKEENYEDKNYMNINIEKTQRNQRENLCEKGEYEQKDIKENGKNEIIVTNNIISDNKEKPLKKKIKKSIKKKKIKQNLNKNEEKEKESKKIILDENNNQTDNLFNEKAKKKEPLIDNKRIFTDNFETGNKNMIIKNLGDIDLRKGTNDILKIEEDKNENNKKYKKEETKNNMLYNNKKIFKLEEEGIINELKNNENNNINNISGDNISHDYKVEELQNSNHEGYKENKDVKRTKTIKKKKKKKLNIYKIEETPNKQLESNDNINKDNVDLISYKNVGKDNEYIKNNKSQTPTKENKKNIMIKEFYMKNSNIEEENEKNSNENNGINLNDENKIYNSNIKNQNNKFNNILNLSLKLDENMNPLRKSPIIKRKTIKKKKYLISLDSKGNIKPKMEEKQLKITKKTTLIRSKSKDRLKQPRNSEDKFDSILLNNKELKYKDIENNIKKNDNSLKKTINKVNNIQRINNNANENNGKIKIAKNNNVIALFLEKKEEIYFKNKNKDLNKVKETRNEMERDKDNNKIKDKNINRSFDVCKKGTRKRLRLNYEYAFDEMKYIMERSNSYKKINKYKKFSEKEKINCIKYEDGISCLIQINSELFALGNLIGDIIIINFHNYKEILKISEHDGTIISLCLLDDKSILSCSADRKMLKIRLKDNGTKYNIEFFFNGYDNYILKAIELMNTFKIVTCSWDNTLLVWQKINKNNYKICQQFNGGERVVDLLEINSNYFVSISESNELKLWSSNTFELIDSLKNIKCICSPNALCKINDIILSVLDYHEIQLVDVTEYKLVNKIIVDDGDLSCIIKLNDNSILVAEDYNSDKYCVFYLKQYYYEEKDLTPISYKRDKFYKTNKNNDKEIRALVQFSNGMIVQGISGEYKGKDSGDLIFYY